MGHNDSPYDDVVHVALIARSCVANYQLPTSSDSCTVSLEEQGVYLPKTKDG